MDEHNKLQLFKELEMLRIEHDMLDKRINEMLREPIADQLYIARHKKRKLQVKDRLTYLEEMLYPDIIA